MKDICVKLLSKHPSWSPKYDEQIQEYKLWMKEHLPDGSYYIPRRKEPIVFFLEEQDLMLFTMYFSRSSYQRIGNAIDMSRVEKMLIREVLLERQNEKSNN